MVVEMLPLLISGLIWLVKILSIRVFFTKLIFVGITMEGIKKFEVIISKKSDVALWWEAFRRSKLKSPPS